MRVTMPITVFCDASYRPGLRVAAFGLLLETLPGSFAAPAGVPERYLIEMEEAYSRPPAAVAASGLVRAVDPTSAEIMAVSAGLEILAGLPGRNRIVVY